MNIRCYLVTEGRFEASVIPEEMLLKLSRNLRDKGVETVHFANRSIEVEGVYIPAKGSKTKLLVLPEED